MNFYILKRLSCLLIPTLFCLSLSGCKQPPKDDDMYIMKKPEAFNTTIGAISEIFQSGVLEVRGFGIVAGLEGTGSSECPDDLRAKLIAQIRVERAERTSINPKAFINSKNTAVVEVYGMMPAIASKGDAFDLRVAPLASTGTTSLKGGRLFTTILVKRENFIIFNRHLTTIATGNGPIFIDKSIDKKPDDAGDYVLSGGVVKEEIRIAMLLHKPNYYTARLIHNMINEKFGKGTANATAAQQIYLTVPPKYRDNKQKFVAMVGLMYLGGDPKLQQERIDSLVESLINDENKLAPEIALEALGKPILNKIRPLLLHSSEKVRLHAARCMLNLGEDEALRTLRKIVENKNSPYRIEAIKAVGRGAKRNDAIAILNESINSKDFETSLAVYEELLKFRDPSVYRYIVAGDFFLDTVRYKGENRIYVSRKGIPKIVIFGEPINCKKNMFVRSKEMEITINAGQGEKFISIWRKDPKGPGIIGPIEATFSIKDVIRILGELPNVPAKTMKRPGLAIPYDEICFILEKMCKSGAINAKFIAGDLPFFPKIDPTKRPMLKPEDIPGFNDDKNIEDNGFNTTPDKEIKPDSTPEWKNLLDAEDAKGDVKIRKDDEWKNEKEWKKLLDKEDAKGDIKPKKEEEWKSEQEWKKLLDGGRMERKS
jgi:hypothetical protein